MYCPKCGSQIADGCSFCPKCGAQLGSPRAQSSEVVPTNVPAQNPNVVYVVEQKPEDSGSVGWGVLGFFIPLVGLILWLVWKDEKPKSAKQAGIGALVSVILVAVVYLLIIVAAASSVAVLSSSRYY